MVRAGSLGLSNIHKQTCAELACGALHISTRIRIPIRHPILSCQVGFGCIVGCTLGCAFSCMFGILMQCIGTKSGALARRPCHNWAAAFSFMPCPIRHRGAWSNYSSTVQSTYPWPRVHLGRLFTRLSNNFLRFPRDNGVIILGLILG